MTLPEPQLDDTDYFAALNGGSRPEQVFHAARVRLIREALGQPAGRVLDVGAGSGCLAVPLAQDGHDMVAVELGAPHLERLRDYAIDRGLAIAVVQGDARRLPFADGSFDTVIVASVVHLAEKPGPILREAERVTRVGGRLLIAGPWQRHPKSNRLIKTVLRGGRPPTTRTYPVDESVLRRYLAASRRTASKRDWAMGYDVSTWERSS